MPLFIKLLGFMVLLMNGFWFIATSMTDIAGADGKPDVRVSVIRKWLLVTFAMSGVWSGIVIWLVVIE